MAETDTRVVELRVSNQKAYVWDVDDIALLRSQHHICGVLTGTLPHVSQQNVFLGIPLVLLPEEVVLLVEKKFAVIVDDPTAHRPPTKKALQQWNKERISSIKAQLSASEIKDPTKPDMSSKALSEEAIRKRKEREAKRAAAARVRALAEGGEEQNDLFTPESSAPTTSIPTNLDTQISRPSTPGTSLNIHNAQYTVTVPASSAADLPWYSSQGCTYSSIESAREAGVWTYPNDLHERAKCGVLRGLWEKGYYMGVGIKFGSDFLVYPGDPLRYHSHFAATVIDSPSSLLRPMEIVAHGRLGTATKKAHLLCGWDDEKKEVSYYSIEWAGFG
ncbi:hypothetical protein K474DRAFT_1632537 [Panus rudis PR-1116 ss-1]|nr:hypothetical protein K474DRAFT_1632537 [Panus rudis PR-1116 ss-1]